MHVLPQPTRQPCGEQARIRSSSIPEVLLKFFQGGEPFPVSPIEECLAGLVGGILGFAEREKGGGLIVARAIESSRAASSLKHNN